MARPERHDVDYFPFIVKRGKTLNSLQGEYGNEGIGFFTNLMRLLCVTPDHHYCIKKDIDKRNFFTETGMANDKDKAIAMIQLMIDTEKLDREIWEKYQVILCCDLIKSLKDAYKKRKNKIITVEEIKYKFQSTYGNPQEGVISTSENPQADGVSTSEYTQTKLKETIVNKTIVKEITPTMADALILSNLILSLHRKVIPDFLSKKDDEETTKRWAIDIEKLIRIDGKSPDVIREVITWVKTPDCWWFPQIESGNKLRKQYEKLLPQMLADKKKKGNTNKSQSHKIAADNVADEDLDKFFN